MPFLRVCCLYIAEHVEVLPYARDMQTLLRATGDRKNVLMFEISIEVL